MFKFDGFVKVSDTIISHGSIHKVRVVKGMLAKCIQDTTSRLLGEGEHTIESTDFQVVGFEDITKSHCIQHGKLTPWSLVLLIAMSYYILRYIIALV